MHKKRMVLQRPKPVLRPVIDAREQSFEFTQQLSFINHTNHDITIVLRDNLPITLHRAPNISEMSKSFIIRKLYRFESFTSLNDVINNLNTLLSHRKDNTSHEDLLLIYKSLKDQQRIGRMTSIAHVNIDREVNIDFLISKGYCYMPEMDLMIYHGKYAIDMIHPYSVSGLSETVFESIDRSDSATGIMFEIIDNENSLSTRYASIGKRVVEIPVKKDPERPSGVYIIRKIGDEVTTEICSLEEMAEKCGIHRNVEDAITSGDGELLYKLKLKEAENAANESKIQYQKEAADAKSRMLQLQEEYDVKAAKLKQDSEEQTAKLKREQEQQKLKYEEELRQGELERQKTKDYYENRSYDRKDGSETIKTVGILAAAALSIWAVARKGS